MIKQVIRLIRPGLFLPCFVVENPGLKDVLVRPRYLSVCAADQRYFQGNRPPEVLARKLPLALFHEAVGEVLRDPSGELAPGTFCVLLPGGANSSKDDDNYRKGAFFRSSNADGFCQELLSLTHRELLPVSKEDAHLYVFTEPLSVCCHAIRRLSTFTSIRTDARLGVWGDGSMGFLMALTLHRLLPGRTILVFGRHDEKLALFSFVDERHRVEAIRTNMEVNIAFECVGGSGAQTALEQAISMLTPCGHLVMLGVSEFPVPLRTRPLLEKGLNLLGASRSLRKDFQTAKELVDDNYVRGQLRKLCTRQFHVRDPDHLADIMCIDAEESWKSLIEVRF